eukprot:TRINITY_DN67533_c3_g4_i2.p1 TRINITY_DN67533_c3_g4~~TRINITY_DN67533_c3_g4_i2.p1  ORF type:complete len:366 (-),score=34.87 TRINITY_DN67533_c3_g4_i2:435-1532(-)
MQPTDYHRVSAAIEKYWPDQWEEMKGMSSAFASHGFYVSSEYLAAWAYWHELMHCDMSNDEPAECTGILTVCADGRVGHFRNLDQSFPPARNMTIDMTFVRDGKTLFQAVDFYWITTGFVTGVKKGVITVEENWRTSDPKLSKEKTIQLLESGSVIPQTSAFRLVMENDELDTYEKAFEALKTMKMSAPEYMIMSGPEKHQAAVVTVMGPEEQSRVLTIEESSTWFLVQTNYDHWKPDPPNDPRRTVAQNTLKDLGQDRGCTDLGGYAAISTPYVYNAHTIFTTVMRAADGSMDSFVREPGLVRPDRRKELKCGDTAESSRKVGNAVMVLAGFCAVVLGIAFVVSGARRLLRAKNQSAKLSFSQL